MNIASNQQNHSTVKCPHCGRINVTGVDHCTNCRYWFTNRKRAEEKSANQNWLIWMLVLRYLIPLAVIGIMQLLMRK